MILHISVRTSPLLWKTNLAGWRAWRPWKLSLHSSYVCASSGPGPLESSVDPSSVSTEKPPHTPVMLKEVLHYLDIQLGQVCFHLCYLFKLFDVLRKLISVCINVLLNMSKIQSDRVQRFLGKEQNL